MIVRLVPFYRLSFQVHAPYQAQVTRQDRFSSKYTSASEITYIRNVSRQYQASQEHVICASASALVCSLLDSVTCVKEQTEEELVWSCSPFAPEESLPWFVSWTTQVGFFFLMWGEGGDECSDGWGMMDDRIWIREYDCGRVMRFESNGKKRRCVPSLICFLLLPRWSTHSFIILFIFLPMSIKVAPIVLLSRLR